MSNIGKEVRIMKSNILIRVLGIVLAGSLVLGVTGAYAFRNVYNRSTMIQKLSERFGLNQEEVETFFEEQRAQNQSQMQQRWEERLNQAVAEGKITEEQKQAIIAKREEHRQKMEGLQDLSPEERRVAMQEYQTEFRNWVEENGLDVGVIGMFGRARSSFGKRPW